MDLQLIGARVRGERERAGLNQRELAERAGLSQPTLARIELGTRPRLTIAELDSIAGVLEIPLRDLTSGNPVRERVRVAARMSEVSDGAREAALRRAVDLLVLDDRLDRFGDGLGTRLCEPTVDLPHPDPRASVEDQGRLLAAAVRTTLDLGGAPIADPAELAERLTGVHTAVVDFPEGIDGYTLTDPDRGVTLIVVGTSAITERQRFTFAHELGHLLFGDGAGMHNVDGGRTPAERRCDAFARHLLAPQEGIRAWLGAAEISLDERVCGLLTRHFRVSLKVLLIQLERMGLLSRAQAEALSGPTGAQLARRYGWGRQYEREQEIGRTIRPPQRLLERATEAYRAGKVGVRVLAGLEGRDPVEMEAALADAGITPVVPQIRYVDVNRLLARTRSLEAGHESPANKEA
ncbi:MAG: helix-turn-helix protein [Actinomycetia bacterium]|nr:helix-turn-helix protein [Actinomycetes bacterium]